MSNTLIYAFLPSVAISSTALIVMLLSAIKRNHLHISLVTSLGLFIALTLQVKLLDTPHAQTDIFVFDGTTALLSTVLILISLLLSLLLYPWLEALNDPKEEYYMLFLLATQGAILVCASSHFASFFLGLELMSLSLVPMVGYVDRNTNALEASIKYLILSAAASAFMLMAMAIIYFYTGTLAFQEIVQQTPSISGATFIQDMIYNTAIILLLVGFAFKLSLAPCHLWIADLFEGSSLPTAALLATLSKAAVFIVLIRLFTSGDWHDQFSIVTIMSTVAAASMIIGNFMALLQNNILRLLAFSSIAHFGYILVAVLSIESSMTLSSADSLASEAAIYYLTAYLISVTGAFAILIILTNNNENVSLTIHQLQGLFWIRPGTATVLILLFLSLAGIPLTIGFIGKFYLTLAAVNAQLWWLLATLVIGSIAGLFYYLRVILIMVEKNDTRIVNEDITGSITSGSIISHTIIAMIALTIVGIGIFPEKLARLIEHLVG